VNFSQLIQEVVRDSTGPLLDSFRPELAIVVVILVLLLQRTFFSAWKSGAFWLTLAGVAAGLFFASNGLGSMEGKKAVETFTGMLVSDSFSAGLRTILYLFTLLFVLFTQISGMPKREDATEFYVLILGALLGMSLMVAANHLIVVLVGMEI
jgi:NADH-quinone oxidoreductase subunit N